MTSLSNPSAASHRDPAFFGLALFRLLVLLTVLVVPVIVIPLVRTMNPPQHSKELALRFLLPALVTAFVLGWPRRSRQSVDIAELALLAFAGVQFLSAAFSGRFLYCLTETWHLWGLPLMAAAIGRARLGPRDFDLIWLAAIVSATLALLYGLSVYVGVDILRPLYPFAYESEDSRNFIHSFLGNPEYFGSYLGCIAVLAFGRTLRPGLPPATALFWLGIALFFLFGLVLTGTRGALMSFAAGSVLAVIGALRYLEGPARRLVLLLSAGAVAFAAVLFLLFSFENPVNRRNLRLANRFVQLFDVTSDSVKERILFYSVGSRMIGEMPVLGSGPGTYRLRFYPFVERLVESDETAASEFAAAHLRGRIAEHAHNDYIEVWVETGTLGFGALLLVLATGFAWWLRGIPQSPALRSKLGGLLAVRNAFFSAAAALLLNAAFSFPLHLPARASLVWALIGGFFAADRLIRARAESSCVGTDPVDTEPQLQHEG